MQLFRRPTYTRSVTGFEPGEERLNPLATQNLPIPGQRRGIEYDVPGGVLLPGEPQLRTKQIQMRGGIPILQLLGGMATGAVDPRLAAQLPAIRKLQEDAYLQEQAGFLSPQQVETLNQQIRENRLERIAEENQRRSLATQEIAERRQTLAERVAEQRHEQLTQQLGLQTEQLGLQGRRLDIEQQRANQQIAIAQMQMAAADARLDKQFRNQLALLNARIGQGRASAEELRNYNFLARATDAERTVRDLEDQIAQLGTLGQATLKFAPNIFQSQAGQLYNQAQRQFTEARLRKESGAAIAASEYESDRLTYFAQPGDTPQTLERKRAARLNLLQAMVKQAGRAVEPGEQPLSGLGQSTATDAESRVREKFGLKK